MFDPTKPYCRRDGKPAKIVYTFEEIQRYLIVSKDSYGIEFSYEAYLNGKYAHVGRGKEESIDLINIPEKIEGWTTIYTVSPTKEDAKTCQCFGARACIKVFKRGGEMNKKIEVMDCQLCPYFTSRMISKNLAQYDYCDNSKKYFINGSDIPDWCLLKDNCNIIEENKL